MRWSVAFEDEDSSNGLESYLILSLREEVSDTGAIWRACCALAQLRLFTSQFLMAYPTMPGLHQKSDQNLLESVIVQHPESPVHVE
jgi:hypothetical protein